MLNFDQAEGLRRMLVLPKTRLFCFLSSSPIMERNSVLINLSASLAQQGQKTLMVDAKTSSSSLAAWLNLGADQSLLDVAQQTRTMDFVVQELVPRLSATKLVSGKLARKNLQQSALLSDVFDQVASQSDMVFVDCELDVDDSFSLSSFDDSEMLIHVSADPLAIKNAYLMIKRIHQRLGRRPYKVVISSAPARLAQTVFSNLAHTAKHYLGLELVFAGAIPDDVYLQRATAAGRSVLDAFPESSSARAFVRLAGQFLETDAMPVAALRNRAIAAPDVFMGT